MEFDLEGLPDGWMLATLPDLVCSDGVLSDGDWVESKDQDPNGQVRLIQLADIGDGYYRDKSERFLTHAKADLLNCTFINQGDLLIARMPDPLGRACIFPGDEKDSVTVVDICIFRSGNCGIDHKCLMHFINSPYIREQIKNLSSGTTRKRISRKNLSNVFFPLPPLNEQRRIVTKIEELTAHSKRAREALEDVPRLIDQFRQSVLAAAFRGDLTAEWRKQNPDVEPASELLERIRAERRQRWEEAELKKMRANGKEPKDDKWKGRYKEQSLIKDNIFSGLPKLPDKWCWSTWESVLSFENGAFKRGPFGSALKKSIFVPFGYKVYEQYCPINDDCSYARYYITKSKFEELQEFAVKPGDFLVSCSGVSLGRITQVPCNNFEEGIINQALLRVRLNKEVIKDQFFLWLFRSPSFQKQISDNSTGSAIPNVKGVKELKAILVPVPPVEEQLVIVKRVLGCLKIIEGIEQMFATSKDSLTQLDQSILAKAFRGELVPQDPNDEPASVLLERIRAEREKLNSTPKNKRWPQAGQRPSRRTEADAQLTLEELDL